MTSTGNSATNSLFVAGEYDYDALHAAFRWQIPEAFNIGVGVCDAQVDRGLGDRTALYYENAEGEARRYRFKDIQRGANRLANGLAHLGVTRGDRVAIILPQRAETGMAYIATFKLGAIAVPLSGLFREEALVHRLADSGTKVIVTDAEHLDMVYELCRRTPALHGVLTDIIVVDDDARQPDSRQTKVHDRVRLHRYTALVDQATDRFRAVATGADDPAYLIYTSGTTGAPKGALCAHRCLLGNLTGFELSQNFFPMSDDVFWTPADWAWTGGLLDALLPSWYYGVPVVAYDGGRFDPERALALLARYRVTNAFVPPTALKMMRQVSSIERFDLSLRAIMAAGESLGAELFHWARERFGIDINEMCGQTECNYIVGNSAAVLPVKPGALGKAYPGHRVDPVDADGNVVPVGEQGELAAHRDDPVMFLGYWQRDAATQRQYRGDYWGLGDVCYRDEDGYLWFLGRDDDIISSAGHRVGPGEIEDSLLKHGAVAQCAVIGSPDALRGEIIKAYIVLASGHTPSESLKSSIQASIKDRLAAHEYPRAIEFVTALPMTTTGKIQRAKLREQDRAARD